MRDYRNASKGRDGQIHLSDDDLLVQFHQDPQQAWHAFIDKYADLIFSLLRGMGFDYDQAMDRFVFVCEKFCEKDFRRMKSIKYAGSRGDLTPWIRQVVRRLCISWAWSEDGRRRLLRPIKSLEPMQQRVFELYFWQGLSPSQCEERLRQEHFAGVEPASIFLALDRILSLVSEKKLWRLVSNLARKGGVVSLQAMDEESAGWDPADEKLDPESDLIKREQYQLLQRALQKLPEQHILIMQFRFEHTLSVREIANILRLEELEVRKTLNSGLDQLRRTLKSYK